MPHAPALTPALSKAALSAARAANGGVALGAKAASEARAAARDELARARAELARVTPVHAAARKNVYPSGVGAGFSFGGLRVPDGGRYILRRRGQRLFIEPHAGGRNPTAVGRDPATGVAYSDSIHSGPARDPRGRPLDPIAVPVHLAGDVHTAFTTGVRGRLAPLREDRRVASGAGDTRGRSDRPPDARVGTVIPIPNWVFDDGDWVDPTRDDLSRHPTPPGWHFGAPRPPASGGGSGPRLPPAPQPDYPRLPAPPNEGGPVHRPGDGDGGANPPPPSESGGGYRGGSGDVAGPVVEVPVSEDEPEHYGYVTRRAFRGGGGGGNIDAAIAAARATSRADSAAALACVYAPTVAPPARLPDADGAQPTQLIANTYYRPALAVTDGTSNIKYSAISLGVSPGLQIVEAKTSTSGGFLTFNNVASPLNATSLSSANAVAVRLVALAAGWEVDSSITNTEGTLAWLDADSPMDTIAVNGAPNNWSIIDGSPGYCNSRPLAAFYGKEPLMLPVIQTDAPDSGSAAMLAHMWMTPGQVLNTRRGSLTILARGTTTTAPAGRWRVREVWEVMPTQAQVTNEVAETAATMDEFLLLREAMEHAAPNKESTSEAALAGGLLAARYAKKLALGAGSSRRVPRRPRAMHTPGQRRMLLHHQSAVAANREAPICAAWSRYAAMEGVNPVMSTAVFDFLLAVLARAYLPEDALDYDDVEAFLGHLLENGLVTVGVTPTADLRALRLAQASRSPSPTASTHSAN